MKTAEAKRTSTSGHLQKKMNGPFFNKGSDESFFSKSRKSRGSFFNRTSIQARLNIGQPNDIYEKEADSMADKVVQRLSDPSSIQTKSNSIGHVTHFLQKKCAHCEEEEKLQKKEKEDDKLLNGELQKKPLFESNAEPPDEEKNVQRKCAQCEKEEKLQKKSENSSQSTSSNIESSLNSSKGSGSTLPTATRQEMEDSFGADFSNVKIHNDSVAAQMSDDINARAFTHGSDIYFNSGKYNSDSTSGKHLLAHELTHVVQQRGLRKKPNKIQRSWLGDAWDKIKGAASDFGQGVADVTGSVVGGVKDAAGFVADKVTGVAGKIGSGLSAAWTTASHWLGSAASAAWSGIKSLGSAAWSWLSSAGKHVWAAIKWFGREAFNIIKIVGSFLWEKLSVLGINIWSFLSNIPVRLWRIIVQEWEGTVGVLSWIWSGLKGAGRHIWEGIKGVFSWLGTGIKGALHWLGEGVAKGFYWAIDFIKHPTLQKLWNAFTGSLSWAWSGLKGFAKWGWNGVIGAAVWAWKGAKGFGSWLWDGFVRGAEWAGKLLLEVLDLVGLFEALQILWGLIFRLRPLTNAERSASLLVHPAGMIPYALVRVDEGSWVARISGYFSGMKYRAVTTAHVIHTAPHEPLHTMVHELTHVAQYEHVGSIYMAQAIHAQAVGGGYNYKDSHGVLLHPHFWEYNREQQAQICEDYYIAITSGGMGSATLLAPLIAEMRAGRF